MGFWSSDLSDHFPSSSSSLLEIIRKLSELLTSFCITEHTGDTRQHPPLYLGFNSFNNFIVMVTNTIFMSCGKGL